MRLHTKKFLLSFFVIVIFVFYAIFQRNGKGNADSALGSLSDLGSGIPIPSEIATPSGIQTSPSSQPSPQSSAPSGSGKPPASSTPHPSPKATEGAAVPTRIPTPAPTPAGLYKDGRYMGPSVDAYYGNVQVVAVVQGGRLTDVQFLDYPRDRGHSVEINTYATPVLRSEAIQAQSAQVDTVSGATATSEAFIQSLSSALNQARA